MHGLGEHVHRLHIFHLIAQGLQDLGISGEGGGIAGDVDDAGGLHAGGGGEDFFAAAGADGVHDDHVRAKAFFIELWHPFAGVGGVEFGIGNLISFCIFLGVFDGFLHDLDADDAFGFLGKAQRNGAGAAVGVDDGLATGELRAGEGFFVEPFGLEAMDLEEGEGGDFEGNAAEGGGQGFLAPKVMNLISQDRIARMVLHVVIDGDHFGQGLAHFLHPQVGEGELAHAGDDDRHDAAFVADPAHDVTDGAFLRFLVVGGDVVAGHEILSKAEEFVIDFFLNEATVDGDHLVAALAVVAKHCALLAFGGRDGHFISVMPGMGGADDGLHQVFADAADAAHHVTDPALLDSELPFVGEVGNLAAAAALVYRASGHRAGRGGDVDGNETPCGVGFLRRHDGGGDGFLRQRAGDEEGEVFHRADAFAMNAEVADGQAVGLALFDWNIFLGHGSSFFAFGNSGSDFSEE